MYFAYFDESKNSQFSQYFHLGAFCVPASFVSSLEQTMNELSQKHFGNFLPNRYNEYHASWLMNGKGHFKEMTLEQRMKILDDLCYLLDLDIIKFVHIRIDCSKYHGNDAKLMAFIFLCEKIEKLMMDNSSIVTLYCDKESKDLDSKYKDYLEGFRFHSTPTSYGRRLNCFATSLIFEESYQSRMIQLADLYTWIMQHRMRCIHDVSPKNEKIREVLLRHKRYWPNKLRYWPAT